MPASIKHKFSCLIADDPAAAAAGMVLPSHFNDEHDLSGLPLLHGFVYPTASSVTSTPFNNATRTFTIAPGAGYDVFIGGALLHITAALTVQIGTGLGQHFIWMTAAGALATSQIAWDLLDTTVTPVATIHWDGATGIVGDERHDSRRNLLEHRNQHESWGAQYVSGFGPSPSFLAANTFSFPGGVIRDEELYHTLSGTQTTCQVGYRVSGGATMTFNAAGTGYAKLNGGVPQYDNGGTLTNLGSGKYGVYWIYATNRPGAPVVSIVGQGEYANVTAAQASVQPTLAGFTVAEWKLLYRVIVRNTGGSLVFSQADVLYNLNSGPAIQAGAPSTVVAGNVTVVPAGNIAATNVQAALEELDTEKEPANAYINKHIAIIPASVTGTTAETVMFSATIPAGTLTAAGGFFRVRYYADHNSVTNARYWQIKLNGSVLYSTGNYTSITRSGGLLEVFSNGSVSSQGIWGQILHSNGAGALVHAATAIDFTGDVTLTISCKLNAAADTAYLRGGFIELRKP